MAIYLICYGGLHALVVAVGLFLQRNRRAVLIPALMLVSVGMAHLTHVLEHTGFFIEYPHWTNTTIPLMPPIGPLLYAFYRRIVEPNYVVGGSFRWHALIVPLCALLLIPFFRLDPEVKALYIAGDYGTPELRWMRGYMTVVVLALLGYVLLMMFAALRHMPMRPGVAAFRESPLNLIAVGFILNTIAVLVMFIIGRSLEWDWLTDFAYVISTGILVLIYIIGERYPNALAAIRAEAQRYQERARYEKSRIEGLDTDSLLDRLRDLMERERLYSDEDLTLATLAAALDITPHQLSQFLNQRLELSFKNCVNGYRVEAARILLEEEPDRSILSIAHAVGFNSKSAFNSAFQRFTHRTPTEYRKAPASP